MAVGLDGFCTKRGLSYFLVPVFIVTLLSCSYLISFDHVPTTLIAYKVTEVSTKVSEYSEKIRPHLTGTSNPREITYAEALQAIYKPLLHPIEDPHFIDTTDSQVYSVGQHHWTKGLGKELCIVDVDTRELDEDDAIFADRFNWAKLGGVSPGMLNHYQYAAIHGYDYKFIRTSEWPNAARDNVWTKPPALRKILQDYRVVLMIDADAIFRHLELPFEWLLNRWNFTNETSLAMPADVNVGYTNNKFGELNPNAGVVVAQNNTRTFDMLDSWIACPDREEYDDCHKFHHDWPAEQGAFGEQIRYKFNESEEAFKMFYCNDANGFPDQGTDCEGVFIRHFTTGKWNLKQGIGDAVLQSLMARTQMEMVRAESGVRVRYESKQIVEEEFWEAKLPTKEMVEEERRQKMEEERRKKMKEEERKKQEKEEEERKRKEEEERKRKQEEYEKLQKEESDRQTAQEEKQKKIQEDHNEDAAAFAPTEPSSTESEDSHTRNAHAIHEWSPSASRTSTAGADEVKAQIKGKYRNANEDDEEDGDGEEEPEEEDPESEETTHQDKVKIGRISVEDAGKDGSELTVEELENWAGGARRRRRLRRTR